MSYSSANSSQPVPAASDIPVRFTIAANASTDVWEKPPATARFSAPIVYQAIPLRSFRRARVSIAGPWTQLYDQGGLILVTTAADGSNRKWIKTGIELTAGKPHLSVVSKDRWADWSLVPLPAGKSTATVEMVREDDNTLWIYSVEENGDGDSRVPLREVTWAFEDEEKNAQCWIGAFAARPSTEGGDLTVEFRGLEVATA